MVKISLTTSRGKDESLVSLRQFSGIGLFDLVDLDHCFPTMCLLNEALPWDPLHELARVIGIAIPNRKI